MKRSQAALVTTFATSLVAIPTVAQADPGELSAVEIDTVGNDYGYWEYLPRAYDEEGEPWPLLIMLSGIGENGNGMLPPGGCSGPAGISGDLCGNLRHGPQQVIWQQLYGSAPEYWNDEERPFVVISPQNPAPTLQLGNPYRAETLDAFLDFLLETYNLDAQRLYLTGMSMGGYSTTLSVVSNPGRYAATALYPGIGAGNDRACDYGPTALWAFHGEDDVVQGFGVNQLVSFVSAVNNCPQPHPVAQATVYLGAGHNVWFRTVNPTHPSQGGMADPVAETWTFAGSQTLDLVPHDQTVYEWLLQFDLPVVEAGDDLQWSAADGPFTLRADVTDRDEVSYAWTQLSGPEGAALAGMDQAELTVEQAPAGSYTFDVFVVDADGQYARDQVAVEVAPAPDVEPGESTGEGGTDEASTGASSSPGSSPAPSTDSSPDSSTPGGGTDSTAVGGTGGVNPPEMSSAASSHAASSSDGAAQDSSSSGCTLGSHSPSTLGMMLMMLGAAGLRRRARKARA